MPFIKKCFLFMLGSVCRLKSFATGWKTFRWWRRVWNGGAEVARTTDKRLLSCGFRRSGKAMGQVYQCWWRICREINIFSRFEYHMFYVLYPFVSYLLPLSRTCLYNSIDSSVYNLLPRILMSHVSSEVLVSTYKTKRSHNTDYHDINTRCLWKL
jgi:hypothetical protein